MQVERCNKRSGRVSNAQESAQKFGKIPNKLKENSLLDELV
jgi:hypothetical protein